MRKKKRMNNKGFSLVEVIVVIAIIGILTVTLTPRLTQYIDKAKVASDQDVANTIYTVAKLADVLNPIGNGAVLGLGSMGTTSVYKYDNEGKEWTLNTAGSISSTTGFSSNFIKEFIDSLDSFKLKAKDISVDNSGSTPSVKTQIYLGKDGNGRLYVFIDYNGNGISDGNDYIVPDTANVPTITPKL